MLPVTFFELFHLYLKNSTLTNPHLFGLQSFSPEALAAAGYERIGEPCDLHFYEKSYSTGYRRRTLEVMFKCYHFNQQPMGSGFGLALGARLTSLLRYQKRLAQQDDSLSSNLAFYFSDDKQEGAVILDDRCVMRFNQWSRKGAYMVSTLESDFNPATPLAGIATDSVKKTFRHHSLQLMLCDARNAKQPAAFRRLAREMNDAII
ncbi:hypothetical protein BLX41_29460 [Pseudomonas protegens]|uniref:hypothetical protein n=1 Tax=Pseudomonas protegens TaxID=380021 RepID=UPI000F4B0221|nr:hypothetical protein [Pseudomonas protegens]ROL63565.1 hypothetical protein BLX41_29460 [Pseudomonas protegens]